MGLDNGCIQIYTGEGKGKTTAALGLALRAVGRGLKVVMIQFLKGETLTGERAASRYLPGLDIRPMGRDGFIGPDGPGETDIKQAEAALKEVRSILETGTCDVLILDEINVAVSLGCIGEEAVLDVITVKPPRLELVLTGRNAPEAFVDMADLVTTMTCTKHYFDRGQGARIGIEY